jgi:hypothetical protein
MRTKKFTLEITLGNDAMRDVDHVARALRLLAADIRAEDGPGDSGTIRDVNGNKVGTWSATWPEIES